MQFMTRSSSSITNDNETSHSNRERIKSKLPKLLNEKKYTRILGRYSFPGFAYDILPSSKIINVTTGKQTTLNQFHKTREIVEIQALDFAGIVILLQKNQKLDIRLGNNELVYRELDYSLIAHQVHFIRYINQANYRAALEELHYIGLWAEKTSDNVAILNYLIAQAHVHDLMGQKDVSRDYYSQVSFHINEKMKPVRIDKVNRIIVKSHENRIASHFNWTDDLSVLVFKDINTEIFNLSSVIEDQTRIDKSIKKKSGHIARLLGIKPYVRIPGRFEIQEFLHVIHPESIVRDSLTNKKYQISSLLHNKRTISIQALDYAGVISLKLTKDGKSEIKPTLNELTYGIKEYSLLAHEMSFTLSIDRFNPRAALNELEHVRNITHENANRQDQFNYMVAHSRCLLRTRDRETRMMALVEFEKALEFLHVNFSDEEITQMTRDRIQIMDISTPFNWNDFLVNYDLLHLMSLYLSTANLMGLLSPYNQYGQLLDELLDLTNKFNATFEKIVAMELKGSLMEKIGETETAISCYEAIFKDGPQSVVKYIDSQDFIIAIIRQLVRLYLQKDDIVGAQQTLDHFSLIDNLEKNVHAYLFHSWTKMEIYNYQGNSEALITEGMKIYDKMYTLDFKYHGSKMAFMVPIFRTLIHGENSHNSSIGRKSAEIIYNIYERNSNMTDTPVLIMLHKLFREELLYTQGEPNIDVLISIHQDYQKLLKNYTNYSTYSFKKLVVHYLNFALTYFDELPSIQKELIEYSEKFIDLLMETTNILLTVRIKIVYMVLTNNLDELKEWLQFVVSNFNIKLLQEILTKVDLIDNDDEVLAIKEQLLDLVRFDIIYEQYELYQAPPLIKVISPGTKPNATSNESISQSSIGFGPVELLNRLLKIMGLD
ncbi:MAG: hypothetical protein HeimC2_46110 [Candidatus Heimdallarchaeota archaeon LC_2]|nr:MAG: hypothetical protein HeimC2_46110 [Candidatus Heimdallarchaeota archaeon LC_2]